MAYPAYVREKARTLRREQKLTIDELAERLAVSRTTIHYWVQDLPLDPATSKGWPEGARQKGTAAMCAKYRRLREEAYAQGRHSFATLAEDPTFRDFVALYIAEGYKRCRNKVALANSDPAVVKLGTRWIRAFASNRVHFSIQYHADQNPDALRAFWGHTVDADPALISLQRKSNSNQLQGRNWRSRNGVLTVKCDDTLLRARLEGWIDCLKECWLDSPEVGV